MNKKAKILILENDPNDIELIQYELGKSDINYESKIVQEEQGFRSALENFFPDIILSDINLPSFHGLAAFKIRGQIAPETPFIIVSGTIGDEKAVELIKNGVTDYALKDKLFSLPTKILRALKEAEEKKEKKIINAKLLKVTHLYAFISQVNQNIVRIKDEATLFRNSCKMAVDFGKFKMAWIGIFAEDYKKINLVEQAGMAAADVSLHKNADCLPEGLTARVLQSGNYFICNNIQTDLKLIGWEKYAEERGINSCIFYQLKNQEK